jgi:hypothetical protein
MNHYFVRGIKYRLLMAAAIGGAATIAACSSPNMASPALPELRSSNVEPDGQPSPTPTPYGFVYMTVDDPKSPVFTRVMGIDDLAQIAGYTKIGRSDHAVGFTSLTPYSSFHNIAYPGASSTVVTSINPGGRILAGYIIKNGNTMGFIREHSLWNEYRDGDTPKGHREVNRLLGVNDNGIAVGYYKDDAGMDHGYELANNKFIHVNPPGAVSAEATAVSLAGALAGNETLKSGITAGWLERSNNYQTIMYAGATSTEINGMSDGLSSNLIVGDYVNSTGTHGYVLRMGGGNPDWQTIDEPNAAGKTVVTGMNNHHDICGWYVDSRHHVHGFVATVPQ